MNNAVQVAEIHRLREELGRDIVEGYLAANQININKQKENATAIAASLNGKCCVRYPPAGRISVVCVILPAGG
jgi:hypothetical protein